MAEALGVAGVVLGGIPVLIWVLDQYSIPYEALTKYGESVKTIQAQLKMQDRALQTTLRNIGLNRQTITNEDLRKRLQEKFPEIASEIIHVVERMEQITAELVQRLRVDTDQRPHDISGRSIWEWSRLKYSLKHKKCEKYIGQLRDFNNDLKRALERPEIPRVDCSAKVALLQLRFCGDRCETIRKSFSTFHQALRSGFVCACSSFAPHRAAIDLDWEGCEEGAGKKFAVAIDHRTDGAVFPVGRSANKWYKYRVTSARTQPGLTPTPIPVGAQNPEILSLCRAIQTTDYNMPTYLRCRSNSNVPQSDQEQRFLFDQASAPARQIDDARPLNAVIFSQHQQQTQQPNPYMTFSPKQRYGIAAAVAWSVLHLGGGPWLDNGWHRDQMSLLLETTGTGHLIPAMHPSIVQSFQIRRKQVQSSSSYRPPGLTPISYHIPNTTVFALGVLLIELCINEPLRKRTSSGAAGQSGSAVTTTASGTDTDSVSHGFDDDDYLAAQARLDDVYRTAGDSYGFAAERCIKHVFVGRNAYKDFEFAQFRKQFYEVVVAPVQATYQQMPGSETWS